MKGNTMKVPVRNWMKMAVIFLFPVLALMAGCASGERMSMARYDDIYIASSNDFQASAQEAVAQTGSVSGDDVSVVKEYRPGVVPDDVVAAPATSWRPSFSIGLGVSSFGWGYNMGYGTGFMPYWGSFGAYNYGYLNPCFNSGFGYYPYNPYYSFYPGWYPYYYPAGDITNPVPAPRYYPSKFYADENKNYYWVNSAGRRYYIYSGEGNDTGRRSGSSGKSRFRTSNKSRAVRTTNYNAPTSPAYNGTFNSGSGTRRGTNTVMPRTTGGHKGGSYRSTGGGGGTYSGKRPR